MSYELIGLLHPHERSETHHTEGALIDPPYVRQLAAAYEASGFDRVLVGWSSSGADPMQLAAYAAAHTQRLGFLVAHRPGFIAPTVAARAYATLDHLSNGRVALHTITGRDDVEQRREGDYLDKSQRYARTAEYLQVLKKAWTEPGPLDFQGDFYRFERFATEVRPLQKPRIPIYFAGASEEAYDVGATHADAYVFYAQPLADFAKDVQRVKDTARAAGRTDVPRIGLIVRPILADTDEAAWRRAEEILAITESRKAAGKPMLRGSKDMDATASAGVSDQRQLEHNRRSARHDTALWTSVAGVTQRGNSTALVGSPATVANALERYADLGVSIFLLHGFDPLEDAELLGKQLVPLLREGERKRGAA